MRRKFQYVMPNRKLRFSKKKIKIRNNYKNNSKRRLLESIINRNLINQNFNSLSVTQFLR